MAYLVDVGLTKEKMELLFAELNEKLAERGAKGEIVLFGGALFVLVLDSRSRTKDIDAVWVPKTLIYELAGEVGERHGLSGDWLNDGVKGWIAGVPEKVVYKSYSNLVIYHADLHYVLAMKCLAARQDAHDVDDVRKLIDILGIKSAGECLEVLFRYYPQKLVPQKSVYFVEEIFDDLSGN